MSDLLQLDTYAFGIQQRLDQEIDPPDDRRELSMALSEYKLAAQAQGRRPFDEYYRDRNAKAKATRGLFSSPDVPGLRDDYNGTDKAEHRRKTANIVFFSNASGLPAEEVAMQLPELQNQWAKRELGKDEISSDEFFNSISSSFALEESARESGYKAALRGIPEHQAYAEWAKANKGAPGWRQTSEKENEYFYMFGNAGLLVNDKLSFYRDFVAEVVTTMQRRTGVKWGRASEDEYDLGTQILNLPEKDQDIVLQSIIELGKAGQAEKSGAGGFVQRLSESIARGGRDLVASLGEFTDYSELVDEREKYAQIAKVERKREADRAAGTYVPISGVSDGDREYLMDADTAEQYVRMFDKAIRLTYMAERVRTIEEEAVDPATSDSWWGQGVLDAGRSLPMTVSAFVPGAQILIGTQFAEDNRHKLKAAFPEMPESRIQQISVLSAPIQAITEVVSDRLLVGRLPNLTKLVKAPVATWGAAALRFLGVSALGFATETGEEVAQDLTPYAVQAVVGALAKDVPTVPWEKVFAGMNAEYFSRLSAAIIPMVLVGSGGANLLELGQGRFLAERPELLEASGYSTEDAAAISIAAKAGNWQEAQRLMRAGYTPEKFESDGAKLERQRAAASQAVAEEVEPKQKAVGRLERLGVIPRIRISEGEGARLTYGDGTTVEFKSYEAANSARWAHVQEQGFRLHASMRAALSRAELSNPEYEYSLTLDPRKMTGDLAVQEGLASEEGLKRAEERAYNDGGASEQTAFQQGQAMAQTLAQDADSLRAASVVLGRNVTDFKNKVREIVLYQGGHNLPTLVHELAETHGVQMLKGGMREFMVSSLREVERQASEEGISLNLFRLEDDSKLTDDDVREAWSEFATAYAAGQEKEGQPFRKLYRAVMRTRLAAVMDAFMRVFHTVMRRAGVIGKLREEGRLNPELEMHVSRALGLEQSEQDAATVSEATSLRDDLTESLDATDAPFSLAPDPKAELQWKLQLGKLSVGTFDRTRPVEFGKTPNVLVAIGAEQLPVIMDANVYDKVTSADKHGLSLDELRRVFSEAHNPLAVLQSDKIADALIVLTSLEHNGEPIIVAIHLDRVQRHHTVNKVESIYAKHLDTVNKWLNDDKSLLYLNTKKPLPLALSRGLKLPKEATLQKRQRKLLTQDDFVNPGEDAPFSLSAGDLDARLTKLFDPFQKSPEARRQIGIAMRDRIAKTREGWRELTEDKRTTANIKRETRIREAMAAERIENDLMSQRLNAADVQALEAVDETKLKNHPLVDHLLNSIGRLMSRTNAIKAGKVEWMHGDYDGAPSLPSWLWGGRIMPDVAAQALYEAGLIKDAYPDTMWNALSTAIATAGNNKERHEAALAKVKSLRAEARQKAKVESAVWEKEALKRANSVGTDRARMMAALRTLNAMLSALPPKVREKVGGYIQVAAAATDETRLSILEKKSSDAAFFLEEWLQEELTSELQKLRDKAAPKGDKGKKATGKLGPVAHRIFAKIEAFAPLDLAGVIFRVDNLTSAMLSETDPRKLADLAEEMQLLEMFGNLKAKSSEALEKAVEFARNVYANGRNLWLTQEKARLEEIKALREETRTAQGVEGGDAELSDARAEETETKGKGLALLSFVQVLERMLGKDHKLVRRWNRGARKATIQKTDGIISTERAWKDLLKSIMGDRSGLQREQRVYELKTERNVIAPKLEGVRVEDVRIPVEKARQILAGAADPKAFGLDAVDVALLATEVAANDALPANRQRDNVDVRKVISTGKRSDVKLTQMQAVHVTMLFAQDMYRAGMEHWGWTQDTLDSIETQLSDEAKHIRSWLRLRYEAGYADLNQVYSRMYGVDLPKVANYAPGTFMHEGDMVTADPYGHGLMPTGGIRAGFVKQRKLHQARPRFDQDALSLFWAHTAHTEHWKAFAELSRELHGVLLNSDVRAAVETKHGLSMMNAVSRWVEAIERGGLEQKGSIPVFDRIARKITGNVAYLALAYNLGTLLKQSTAALGSMLRMPVSAYAKGFGRLMSGKLDARAMWNSPTIQRRIVAGYSPEVRSALAKIWDSPPSRAKKFIEAGLQVIGLVDGFFTTASAAIAYDYHYGQAREAGLNDMQAKTVAARETEDVIARTAQPVEVVDRSLMELGLNSFGRLLFMFATESRQKWALLQEAVVNREAEGGKADLRRVVAFHVVTGLLLQGIGAAWRDARDDDDEELFDPQHWNWKSMLLGAALGPLNGVPLINDIVASLNGYHGTQLGKAGQAVSSTGALLEAAIDGEIPSDEDAEWIMKRLVEVFNGFGIFLGDRGVSVGVGSNVAKQLFELSDNMLED